MLILVKKFIDKLRQGTGVRRPNLITNYHAGIINDECFFFENFKEKTKIQLNGFKKKKRFKFLRKILKKGNNIYFEIKEKIEKILKKTNYVFDPSHKLKIFWDVIKLLVIVFYFFVIPLDLSLDTSIFNQQLLNTLSILFFITDILLNFNTAYFERGGLCFLRSKIMKNYLKSGYLVKDIFCLYPLIDPRHRNIFHLIIFIQFIHFLKLMKNIQKYLFADEKTLNYLNLIKLLFNVILLSHIFACLWLYLGDQYSIDKEKTWIKDKHLEGSEWQIKYLYAYYYVVITMNTVGYG